MTRIVFLTHSAAPAGAELALLHELGARGPEHDVLTIFAEDGEVVRRFAAAGIPYLVLPMGRRLASARRVGGLSRRVGQALGLVGYARAVRRALQHHGADVVVGRSLKAVVYGRLATVGLGVPFVWCLHDRLTPEYLGRSSRLWSHGLSRTVDAVVVNSRSTLETVSTGRKPVLVLPPASAADPRTTTPSPGPLRLLCLGRLSPWKGQDVALRAFAEVFGGTGATLRVVGGALFEEHEHEQLLVDLVTELGLASQVELVGQVDDPVAEIASCDVLVHASRIPEPFGLVVVEGLRAGCVVVATCPGGPAEVLTDGVTGLLADVDSVPAMTTALRRVAAMTDGERAAMSRAGRQRAAAYDPAVLCETHLTWLAHLADGSRVPALSVAGPR